MSKSANKILITAEKLFNQNNFTSVGVDLIRDESGCSKTTMYTYFKNKHELVVEVLKQRDLRFRTSLVDFIGVTHGIEALEKIYDWHINWFQADHFKGCLFVRAVADCSEQDHDVINISIEHKQWLRDLINEKVQQIDPKSQLGDVIYTLLEGLISRFLVEGFDQNIATQQRKMMHLLIEHLSNF